ncbi:hypothetical protein [Actinacidiphila glaucinigra]
MGEAACDELVRASAKGLRSALIGDGAGGNAETGARRTDGPVHTWFVLLYSTHEVLPRTLMQSMPLGWQRRMVACLQLREAFAHVEQPEAKVERPHGVSGLVDATEWLRRSRDTGTRSPIRACGGLRPGR